MKLKSPEEVKYITTNEWIWNVGFYSSEMIISAKHVDKTLFGVPCDVYLPYQIPYRVFVISVFFEVLSLASDETTAVYVPRWRFSRLKYVNKGTWHPRFSLLYAGVFAGLLGAGDL